MRVSEVFYSVQGEGVSTGTPSVFIRLTGCNLICGGHMGQLQSTGQATWWCDTETVWRQGTEMSAMQLVEAIFGTFPPSVRLHHLRTAAVHLIWTGGEPTIPRSRAFIESVLNWLNMDYAVYPYSELETNGTLMAPESFWERIGQVNCSPKLSNSGMPESMRINSDVLRIIDQHKNGWFKFVVSREEDLVEIERTFLPHISPERVILMPAVSERDQLADTTRLVWELAMKTGYRMCSRLHVLCYDQTTGV